MPTHYRLAEVNLPEAALLADYYGILQDLEIAFEWCQRAIDEAEKTPTDLRLIEALVTGVIVKYFRCFSSGARFGLKVADMADIGDELLARHSFYKHLRDKFVAHPVNPYEESYATISIGERDGETIVGKGVSPGHTRLLLSDREAHELMDLIRAVQICIRPKIEAEEAKVVELIHQLPKDVLKEWDVHTPHRMKASDVAKSRRRALIAGSSRTR